MLAFCESKIICFIGVSMITYCVFDIKQIILDFPFQLLISIFLVYYLSSGRRDQCNAACR